VVSFREPLSLNVSQEKDMMKPAMLYLLVTAALCCCAFSEEKIPAFPGAEGSGAYSNGDFTGFRVVVPVAPAP
jgi:hypothetical protein